MSYRYTDRDGDTMDVYSDRLGSVVVKVEDHADGEFASVSVPKDEVPALALALLEEAGYVETDGRIGNALFHLREHRDLQIEAREQKALDAEARELFEAYRSSGPYSLPLVPWAEQPANVQQGYVAIARTARQIHAAKESAK